MLKRIDENCLSLNDLLGWSLKRTLDTEIKVLEELRATPESNTLKCRSLRARVEVLNDQLKRVEEVIARRKSLPGFYEKRIQACARFTPTAMPIPTAPTAFSRNSESAKKIAGYGAVFYDAKYPGTEFQLCPGVFERIAPTAFHKVLHEKQDVRGLFNHNPDWILGRTGAGTMRLSVDSRGLRYEIDIDTGDPIAKHIADAVERGDIDGSSFGFTIESDTWTYDSTRKADIRTITAIETLYDTGPVTFPAYRATTAVCGRSDLANGVGRIRPGVENALREIEISRKHGENLFKRKANSARTATVRTSTALRIEPIRSAQNDSAEYCRKRRWQLCFG